MHSARIYQKHFSIFIACFLCLGRDELWRRGPNALGTNLSKTFLNQARVEHLLCFYYTSRPDESRGQAASYGEHEIF